MMENAPWLLATLVWVLACLGTAVGAFLRFRTTLTGWLIGASFAVRALKDLAFFVLVRKMSGTLVDIVGALDAGIDLVLWLAIAAGIACIQRSLRALSG